MGKVYGLRDIQAVGIARATIRELIAAGIVTPTRDSRGEYRFGFPDMVLFRTAQSLRNARIPRREIVKALRRAQELGFGHPAGMRLEAVGGKLTLREGDRQWHVDTGQMLLDFGDLELRGKVVEFRPRSTPEADVADAYEWVGRAVELETTSPEAAEAYYRRAIAALPAYLDAYLHFGCMLCEMGRLQEALELYTEGLRFMADEPLLHYNLGVVLEDSDRPRDALASYDAAIALEPGLADAHFNAARLHELLGDSQSAIRHYSQYRRLER